jgi:hypothetical protein
VNQNVQRVIIWSIGVVLIMFELLYSRLWDSRSLALGHSVAGVLSVRKYHFVDVYGKCSESHYCVKCKGWGLDLGKLCGVLLVLFALKLEYCVKETY